MAVKTRIKACKRPNTKDINRQIQPSTHTQTITYINHKKLYDTFDKSRKATVRLEWRVIGR